MTVSMARTHDVNLAVEGTYIFNPEISLNTASPSMAAAIPLEHMTGSICTAPAEITRVA